MATTVLCGAQVVTPEAVLPNGWVLLTDGMITGVGSARTRPRTPASEVLAQR